MSLWRQSLVSCWRQRSTDANVLLCRRLLFAKDFRQHMQAADMLLSQLEGLRQEVLSCLDLLLRWAVLRICDANTQCLLKVLDLTKALFTLATEEVDLWRLPLHLWHPAGVLGRWEGDVHASMLTSRVTGAIAVHSLLNGSCPVEDFKTELLRRSTN